MSMIWLQNIIFLFLLVGIALPLGIYIYKVMTGQNVFLSVVLKPMEKGLYRLFGIPEENEMSAARYNHKCTII